MSWKGRFQRNTAKKTEGHFKLTPLFFSTMGSKLPSSHTAEVLVLIAKKVMPASKFSIPNWEGREPRNGTPKRAARGREKREVAIASTGFSFLVQLGEAKHHLAEKITFLP